MKCYYTYTDDGERILIPMCYGTIHSFDIEDCVCQDPLTVYHFEKQRYNEVLASKNETIKSQASEIKHLHKVILSLKKHK